MQLQKNHERWSFKEKKKKKKRQIQSERYGGSAWKLPSFCFSEEYEQENRRPDKLAAVYFSKVAKFHQVVIFWCTHTPTGSWKYCVFCVPTNFQLFYLQVFWMCTLCMSVIKSCSTALLQKSVVPSSRNLQVWQFSLPDVGWSLPFLGLCASWAVPKDSSCLELEKK